MTVETIAYSARNSDVWQVPVELIEPWAENPRSSFDEASLQELAESIKEHGVLEPMLVRPAPPVGATGRSPLPGERRTYLLVAGERRWRADLVGRRLRRVASGSRDLRRLQADERAGRGGRGLDRRPVRQVWLRRLVGPV